MSYYLGLILEPFSILNVNEALLYFQTNSKMPCIEVKCQMEFPLESDDILCDTVILQYMYTYHV